MRNIRLFNVALLLVAVLFVQDSRAQDTLEGHTAPVFSVVFSPDGTRLASASQDGTVKLWDGATRENIATLKGHTDMVFSVVFSPDGTRLASASRDSTVKLWDVATKAEIATLEGHTWSVNSVVFSPDGTRLASASFDGTVKLWDVASRAEIATLEGHTDLVFSVVFSPDGTRLASASADDTIKLWDVASRAEIATLEGHTSSVYSVVFSPDGTRLASASRDDTVKLWDVATRENIATLEGHTSSVYSVVFSPDGTRLASASRDGTVKLWDGASRAEIATLKGHTSQVTSVVFSPDGTQLASASYDDTIKLWDVSPSQLVKIVKISGDEQRGAFGSTLANPLVVEVRDLDNNPFPGVEVTFRVTRGEGKLSGQSTVEQVTTDANGRAEAILTLGPIPGTNTVEVSIGHESVTFHAVVNSPSQLVKISGDEQQGAFGSTLANPLVVEVRDLGNNPFPGVEVTFRVTDGEGKLSGQSTVEQVTTDANGRAEAILTLGPIPGTNTVGVWLGVRELATFRAVGVSPYQLTKISGDEQRGAFGSTLANPLVVEVRDLDNDPLPGVEVTFTVTRGEGMLSGQFTVEQVTTDANGRAEAILTLGPDLGTNTVEVSIGRESVTFRAVGVSPYQLTKISGDEQRGAFGSTLANPLVVEVRDLDNNPLPSVEVTFRVTRGGGKLSGQSTVEQVTTDANGRAEAILTLGPDLGTNTVEVSIGHESVTFRAVGVSPYQLTKISGDEQQGTFGSALVNPLVVEVRDLDNNPLPGVEVTFTVTYGEGMLSGQSTVAAGNNRCRWAGSSARSPLGHNSVGNAVEVSIGHELVTFHAVGVSPYEIATLEGHTWSVSSVVFSPDGTRLASASRDGTVKLWDAATRAEIATLEGHTSYVFSVVFSPDGTMLASASNDGTVKLWDVATKENIATLEGHTWSVLSVVFSPDGTRLASASYDANSAPSSCGT